MCVCVHMCMRECVYTYVWVLNLLLVHSFSTKGDISTCLVKPYTYIIAC